MLLASEKEILLGTLVHQLDKLGALKSCINCEHFQERQELCLLVDKRPPARTIARGCEKHEYGIPF